MAYTAWSVVFGEQPTAAKWNQLGTNDAGFKDGTNIDDDAILERHLNGGSVSGGKLGAPIGAIANIGSNNLTSGGTITLTVMTELYDSDGSLTSGAFTAPYDGVYAIGASVQANNTGAGRLIMWVYVNEVAISRSEHTGSNASHDISVEAAYDYPLDAGDVVTLRCFQESGSTQQTALGVFSVILKGKI